MTTIKNISTHTVDGYGQLSRELKGMCVRYIYEHLIDELDQSALRAIEGFGSLDASEAVETIDAFLLFGTTRSGMRTLEVICENALLDQEQQKILADWKEKAFPSIFEITGVGDESLKLFDVCAEVTYVVYVNDREIAATLFPSLNVGSFMATNLVPIYERWFLSGAQKLYARSSEPEIMQMLAENFHIAAQYRNNPEKLALARALQKEEHERFIRFFQTDEMCASSREISCIMETYYKMRAEELGHANPLLPDPLDGMGDELDLGLVVDEREGVHYFSNYGQFVDVFAQDVGARGSFAIVRDYLEDDSTPAFVFRRMAERYPESFRSIMRTVLGRSYAAIDPVEDLDSIMDDFKSGWRDIYPSTHPVNLRVQKYLYGSSGAGRNDPCPCESGKKFKKCHG